MNKFSIYYKDGTSQIITILIDKNTNKYRYCNLSKSHICKCQFDTLKDALNDLTKYNNIDGINVYTNKILSVEDFIDEYSY